MIRLKNKFLGKEAVIIVGGPSIIENKYDLSLIQKRKSESIIFLDARALTPKFLSYEIEPHYFLMYFPEKGRTNTLQQCFIQAASSAFDLKEYVKEEFIDDWVDFKDNFHKYAEIWDVFSPFKKFRIRKDVVMKNSPFDLLHHYKNMPLVTFDYAYERDNAAALSFPNEVYKYTHNEMAQYDLVKYYNPEEVNGVLSIPVITPYNTSAMALYPILKYMGFKKIFFIGMDMSLLGHLEYSGLYTFKSMVHYSKFFDAVRPTFSPNFPRGIVGGLKNFVSQRSAHPFKNLCWDIWGLSGKFMRDRRQLADCKKLFSYNKMEFVNIYEPFKYAKPIPGIRNISYKDFLKE